MIDRTILIQTDGWVRASASLDVYAADRCCHCYRKTGKTARMLHTARTNDGEWWVVPPGSDLSGDEWRDFGVDNCAGCPFYRWVVPRSVCVVALTTRGTARYITGAPPERAGTAPPDWCPLRRADHLVTLRVK